MKQINLLPTLIRESRTDFVHPFWIRLALISVLVIAVSSGISLMLQHRIRVFERQLNQYQANLADQQPELERFRKLIQERNTLKQQVERLQHELESDLSQVSTERTGMAKTLHQITTGIPREVWLKTLDCDWEKHLLMLNVSAESERNMKDFLLGELPQLYGPTSINVTAMQRPAGAANDSRTSERHPIDFQVTIQLPSSATQTLSLSQGAG